MSGAPRASRERDGTGWLSWRLLREAVRRLHRSYEERPVSLRRRWWRDLLVGAVLVQVLTLGLVWAGKRAEAAGWLRWEEGVLRWFEQQSLLSYNTALWLEGIANGFVLWLLMLYAAARLAWLRLPLRSLAVLVGYTLVYLHIATGWIAWGRERPTLIAQGMATPGGFFNSYPSGHMVQACFAYGILLFFWTAATRSATERAAGAALYLGVLAVVAVGRLRLGSHWPSDIFAGTLIGVAWLAAVVVAQWRAERASRP